jgi:hypothetical protein
VSGSVRIVCERCGKRTSAWTGQADHIRVERLARHHETPKCYTGHTRRLAVARGLREVHGSLKLWLDAHSIPYEMLGTAVEGGQHIAQRAWGPWWAVKLIASTGYAPSERKRVLKVFAEGPQENRDALSTVLMFGKHEKELRKEWLQLVNAVLAEAGQEPFLTKDQRADRNAFNKHWRALQRKANK